MIARILAQNTGGLSGDLRKERKHIQESFGKEITVLNSCQSSTQGDTNTLLMALSC